jgi:putative transposase
MKKLQIPLEEGKLYHIFNRGNNGDNLFYTNENYRFFLRRLDEYLSAVIEVYAFCLLPNHFHLLIRVKTDALPLRDAKRLTNHDPVSLAFLRLFTSYSKAINKQENRHGSLFENPFKRKEITDSRYLSNVVYYIHANPQIHNICDDFKNYPWSSYNRIITQRPSKLNKGGVLEWFNGSLGYIAFHAQKNESLILEEISLE